MQVYYSLDTLPWIENCAVTIGTFDGLHLGHLSLLNKLKESENNLVITFSNHPLEVFQEKTIKRLTTPNQKIELFLESGIKNLLIFHFDPLLAQVSFKNFLHTLFQKGMRKLLLGKGSTIGAKREGNEQTIPSFAKATGFSSFFFSKKNRERFSHFYK